MADMFRIHLTIAGKSYPLTIERQKEERYRRAEREVNAVIEMFKGRFRADADSDYLAMAALQLAVNGIEMELRGSLDGDTDRLRQIERQLDEYMKEI